MDIAAIVVTIYRAVFAGLDKVVFHALLVLFNVIR